MTVTSMEKIFILDLYGLFARYFYFNHPVHPSEGNWRAPKVSLDMRVTSFIRLDAEALIKFSAFQMRCIFKSGVYFEITFLKSPTAVAVNRL